MYLDCRNHPGSSWLRAAAAWGAGLNLADLCRIHATTGTFRANLSGPLQSVSFARRRTHGRQQKSCKKCVNLDNFQKATPTLSVPVTRRRQRHIGAVGGDDMRKRRSMAVNVSSWTAHGISLALAESLAGQRHDCERGFARSTRSHGVVNFFTSSRRSKVYRKWRRSGNSSPSAGFAHPASCDSG